MKYYGKIIKNINLVGKIEYVFSAYYRDDTGEESEPVFSQICSTYKEAKDLDDWWKLCDTLEDNL